MLHMFFVRFEKWTGLKCSHESQLVLADVALALARNRQVAGPPLLLKLSWLYSLAGLGSILGPWFEGRYRFVLFIVNGVFIFIFSIFKFMRSIVIIIIVVIISSILQSSFCNHHFVTTVTTAIITTITSPIISGTTLVPSF